MSDILDWSVDGECINDLPKIEKNGVTDDLYSVCHPVSRREQIRDIITVD